MTLPKTMKQRTLWIALTGLFMAMNIVLSMSIFSVPVPGGHLYVNDIVIVFASIILDPVAAFMVGGVGAFLGDLLFYPAPMFVSLITHGLQAVLISLFSHYVLKKYKPLGSGIGVTVGGIVEIIGYSLGRAFFYGSNRSIETAIVKLPFQVLQVLIGAVIGMLLCYAFGLRKLFDNRVSGHLYTDSGRANAHTA